MDAAATGSARTYQTPKAFQLPNFVGSAGVRRVGGPRVCDIDTIYVDTDDLRLTRHRMTLRRRTAGVDAGWQLTTPGTGDDRTQHRLPLGDPEQVPAGLLALVRPWCTTARCVRSGGCGPIGRSTR